MWDNSDKSNPYKLKYSMLDEENKGKDLFFVHPYWTSGEEYIKNDNKNKNWEYRDWINNREISIFSSLYYFDSIPYTQIENSSINIGFTKKFKKNENKFEEEVQTNDLSLKELIGKGWIKKEWIKSKANGIYKNKDHIFINVYIEEMSGNTEFDNEKKEEFKKQINKEIKEKHKK
ncbi:hypothetical protein [Mycoplasma phocimorsus]|uniref:hypothetical protein n=1 Tax=Mycoplasma phocimorsus TaxID=3045839 RepID=UPI0024BF99EB|nr:hypothetical protein [Mycoplasma phocimorsus]MDJ1646312.1 hypothetical protein [Mycoplasma phocimorsus]